jgi:endo-1,4-beta-xylanase
MDRLTRRTFAICGASAVGALSGQPTARADGDPQTLIAAGRAAGIDIGTAMRADAAPRLATLIARECNLVTPENALKPATLSPVRGQYRWSEADRIYGFAGSHGLKFHGHTLYWYKRPLPWAKGGSLDEVAARYGELVAAVTGRYAGAVSWDVCNEIAGTSTLLRDSFPISRFGLDFVERLLHEAHRHAPKARLAINENDLECGDGDCAAKRDNVLKIVSDLKARGAPLHALGIQSHLGSHRAPSPAATLAFIRAIAAQGVAVYISELDVNDSDLAADKRRRDEEVAAIYRDYLDTVLQSKAVKRIVFWGLTDSANWIADGGARRRRDGDHQRPALFDRTLGRKLAYFQVLEALKGAAAR